MRLETFPSIDWEILPLTLALTVAACSGDLRLTENPGPVPVASVDVRPALASVQMGQSILLTATPRDAAGSPLPGRTVIWATSDAAVATVDGTGLVTGVGAGSAIITATSERQSASSAVTVSVPVVSVDLTPVSASVAAGESIQLTATPKDAAGRPLSGRTVTWASSDPGLADVSSNGLVSGLGAGSITITATAEGKSGTAAMRVLIPLAVSCLTQTGPTVTLSGVYTTAYANTSVADNTRIDASTAQFLTVATVPVSVGGGASICFRGGETIGQLPPSTDWDAMHSTYGFQVRGIPNFALEAIRVFDYGDGVAFNNNAPNWSIRGVHFKYVRDDCVENDYVNSGNIEDSFFDGCYAGFSSRPFTSTSDGTKNLVVVKNSLFRLQDMDQGFAQAGHGGFFKWSSTGPLVALYNNVYRLDSPSTVSGHTLGPPSGKLWDCADNVMIWLGSGPFPEALPGCYTVLTGTVGLDYWNNAVAQWKADHPNTLLDVGPPLVSMYAPSAGATLTGTVSLTATAVDDQDAAGVQFQLNGQAIGLEVATDSPLTKFTLVWDSRSVPNGTYALTATARDSSGNTKTSAAVTIAVSN